MPVILRPEDEELWLDVFRTTFIKARSVLKPLRQSWWMLTTFHQSSTRRSMMGQSASSLLQTTYLAAVSCPCC